MAIEEKQRDFISYLEQAIKIIGKMGIRIEAFKKGYVKVVLPKEPNVNHIGTVYAGSLFSLADYTGGVFFFATFDHGKYYPILKAATITFRRPATTDITVEAVLTPEQVISIQKTADETGKSDWVMDLELKDTLGNTCAIVSGSFQMRKA
jgi:thioesterase domain-containing protein